MGHSRFDTLFAMLPIWEIFALLLLGLCAGSLGGLIGIGGGVITIPVLSILFGKDIHLAQAASMNVVVFVAVPAAIRHFKQGELPRGLLKYIIPFGVIGIIVGVFSSNHIPDDEMMLIFGLFLLYVIVVNILKLLGRKRETTHDEARISVARGAAVGTSAGFGAGLLGIGGGLITVPLAQHICRLTLPHAIAISAGLMCFTSIIGAVVKDATLHTLSDSASGASLRLGEALQIAIWIFPTAIIGAWMGARLTHILPIKWIRGVFVIVLAAGAAKMLWPWMDQLWS